MASRAIADNLRFRPVDSQDSEFLFRLYADTRCSEMALLDWTDLQKQTFLRLQFAAQSNHYITNFPDASHQLILHKSPSDAWAMGEQTPGKICPIGHIHINRTGQEIRLVNIALLAAYRNQGIGHYLVTTLQHEAVEHNVPIYLHVEYHNHDALRFYKRLGFVQEKITGMHQCMAWRPTTGL